MRKADRMIFPFSHDASIPCQQDRLAFVDMLAAILGLHKGVMLAFDRCSLPSNAASVLVDEILRFINRAKVADTVVGLVSVDVVNFLTGLLTARQKPSNAMSEVRNTFVSDADVALEFVACNIAGFHKSPTALKPNKIARFGAVINYITDRIGYKSRSHFVLPHNLVRGLAVSAVSTPILSQEVSL